VKFELAHLEGRRVAMPYEISDQPAVILHFFGSLAIGNARGPDNRLVGTHVIHKADESIVEAFDWLIKPFFRSPAASSSGSPESESSASFSLFHGSFLSMMGKE